MAFDPQGAPGLWSRVIDDFDELEPYEREWDSLAVAGGQPTCRPAWLRSWWEARCAPADRGSRALRVVVVTAGDRLVGLFPGFLVDRTSRLADLRLIGEGVFWSVAPLVSQDAPGETFALFARALSETAPPPARVVLMHMATEAKWPSELRRQWPGGPAWLRRGNPGKLLVIEGPLSSEAWFAGLSQNRRSSLRRLARRRAEAGLAVQRTETAEAIRDDVHALAELHQARWNWESKWLAPGVEEMLAEAGRQLLRGGGWHLWKVVRGDEVLGATLFARAGHVSEMLVTGFDSAWSGLGPGVATIVAGIEHELDSGAQLIDFGHGGFRYLQRLSNAERPVVNYELFPANHGLPIAWARWLIPHGRERVHIWRKRLRLGQRLRAIRGDRTA